MFSLLCVCQLCLQVDKLILVPHFETEIPPVWVVGKYLIGGFKPCIIRLCGKRLATRNILRGIMVDWLSVLLYKMVMANGGRSKNVGYFHFELHYGCWRGKFDRSAYTFTAQSAVITWDREYWAASWGLYDAGELWYYCWWLPIRYIDLSSYFPDPRFPFDLERGRKVQRDAQVRLLEPVSHGDLQW